MLIDGKNVKRWRSGAGEGPEAQLVSMEITNVHASFEPAIPQLWKNTCHETKYVKGCSLAALFAAERN